MRKHECMKSACRSSTWRPPRELARRLLCKGTMPGPDLTITRQRHIPRPDAALVQALASHTTSAVSDALGRRAGLGPAIRPLTLAQRFAGPALTVRCRPGDNLAALVALMDAVAGDVVVIACDGATDGAIVGGAYVQWARQRGVVAVVTDGLVRDADELDELGLPVFGCGYTPNGPFKTGPGEIGLPVTLGGVTVAPGDIVLGDRDGVAIVPRARAAEAIEAAERVRRGEADSTAAFQRGETPGWLAELTQRARVRDLEDPRG